MPYLQDLAKLQNGITREKIEDEESLHATANLSDVDALTYKFFLGRDNNLKITRTEPVTRSVQYEVEHEQHICFCLILLSGQGAQTRVSISLWLDLEKKVYKLNTLGWESAKEFYDNMIRNYCDRLHEHGALPASPNTAQVGAAELPSDITFAEIDTLSFDIYKMKNLYRDFSEDKAREILKAIPEISKKLRKNEKLRAGKIADNKFISLSLVSNHYRALYTMGLRTVEGIPLPYKPRNSTK
jgi:hypothetical protein